jgi:hypothetical protein
VESRFLLIFREAKTQIGSGARPNPEHFYGGEDADISIVE